MKGWTNGMDRRSAIRNVSGILAAASFPLAATAHARAPLEGLAAADNAGGQGPTLTARVSDYCVRAAFAALPAAAREMTKKVIFDEIAASYFGRRSTAGTLILSYVSEQSGTRQARIWGSDKLTARPLAALANGTAGHGDEVDGAHVIGGHPGATIVHAAAAMADGQGVSGADFINAVALGYDVGVRLVEACGGKFTVRDTFHLDSDLLYALGAAAASGRLLHLDQAQYGAAFALATFQANGLYALYAEANHISKSFCNGQYAHAGVSAALMARIGMEGHDDIIGTKDGIYAAWGDGKHREAITSELGASFKILGANFKFFNAGYPIHTAVEAAMILVRDHHISPDNITAIHVGMPETSLKTVDNRAMHIISVQDMVAATIASGGLKLVDRPFPAILADPAYQRLRSLIVANVDPELNREFPNGRGARVTITTVQGARYSLRIDNPRGHSLRGEVTWNDLVEKWRDALPGCDVSKALSLARRLDELDNVDVFFDAFKGVNG